MRFFLPLITILVFSYVSFSQNDTIFLNKKGGNKIYIDGNVKVYEVFRNKSSRNIIEKYVPIYQYQKKYYLYSPCDWSYNFTLELSSKSIFLNSSEKIKYDLISKKKNCIRFKNSITGQKGVFELKSYKNNKDIFISKIKMKNQEPIYRLMINSKDVKKFKIINNDCRSGRVPELEFEEIDLEKEF